MPVLLKSLPHLLVTLAIGAVGAVVFDYFSLPLPWLLGSLTATLAGSLLGFDPRIPVGLFTSMLVILGVYAGSALNPDLLASLLQWPLTLTAMALLVVANTGLNTLYFHRFAGFSRVTALFASVPGAQSIVLITSARYGSDDKQVLIPQIARVLAVIYFIPLIMVTFGGWAGLDTDRIRGVPDAPWVIPGWWEILLVLAAILAGLWLAQRLRWPQPRMLGPLCGVALLQVGGATDLSIPGQALIPVQFILGTYLGSKFARIRWRAALNLSFHGIVALLLTVALVFAMTAALTLITDVPAAAIFLAFAPGGLPEMVLISATLNVDPAFVVVHHITRFLIIAIALPWAAERIAGKPDKPDPGL